MPRTLSLARLRSDTRVSGVSGQDPVTSPTIPGQHRRQPLLARVIRAAARGAALYAAAAFMTVSLALWQVYARLEARRALEAQDG
jgi:hypothetical protein